MNEKKFPFLNTGVDHSLDTSGNSHNVARKTKVIDLLFFDAGGGHRSAMNGLREALALLHPEWIIRPVDVQKLLEPVDPVFQSTKKLNDFLKHLAPDKAFGPVQSQEIYNRALKSGVTYGMNIGLPVMQFLIRANSEKIENALRTHWQEPNTPKPDGVFSLIPNFDGPAYRAVKSVYSDVPFGTIITDFVDCPPHFWMEDQDQFMICGTKDAFDQAHATGFYRPESIFEVSGMILKQAFYDRPEVPRLSHKDLGLDPNRPTALIMFGGNGSSISEKIVNYLAKGVPHLQTGVMCGHSTDLYNRLQGRAGCYPVKFVPDPDDPLRLDVPDFIRPADFGIGKAGPGAISQFIHLGKPFITERNAKTMPQERPNTEFIEKYKVGIVVDDLGNQEEIVKAVKLMLRDLGMYKHNIRTNIPPNRAVFEIVKIFEHILSNAPAQTPDPILRDKPSRISAAGNLIKRRLRAFPHIKKTG